MNSNIDKTATMIQADLIRVQDKLLELTDGEEDKELARYNEDLLRSLEDARKYIDTTVQLFSAYNNAITSIINSICKVRATCEDCTYFNFREAICRECGQQHINSEWKLDERVVIECINNSYKDCS